MEAQPLHSKMAPGDVYSSLHPMVLVWKMTGLIPFGSSKKGICASTKRVCCGYLYTCALVALIASGFAHTLSGMTYDLSTAVSATTTLVSTALFFADGVACTVSLISGSRKNRAGLDKIVSLMSEVDSVVLREPKKFYRKVHSLMALQSVLVFLIVLMIAFAGRSHFGGSIFKVIVLCVFRSINTNSNIFAVNCMSLVNIRLRCLNKRLAPFLEDRIKKRSNISEAWNFPWVESTGIARNTSLGNHHAFTRDGIRPSKGVGGPSVPFRANTFRRGLGKYDPNLTDLRKAHGNILDVVSVVESLWGFEILLNSLIHVGSMTQAAYFIVSHLMAANTLSGSSLELMHGSAALLAVSTSVLVATMSTGEDARVEDEKIAVLLQKMTLKEGLDQTEVISFLQQTRNRKVSFSACGFLSLDRGQIMSVIGGIITYIFVLFQFKNV